MMSSPFASDADPEPVPETPSWSLRLERFSAERLLVLLGGASALAFGSLSLLLSLLGEGYAATPLGFTRLGGSLFAFVLTLVFGLFLLLAYGMMERRPGDGSVMAIAFSVVLLAFGGAAGTIGGLVGLVGALVGVVRNLRIST